MKRNILSLHGLALAAVALFGSVDAGACTVAAWTATNTTATDANSGSPSAVRRYAGLCGLSVASATPVVVADNSPEGATETTYRARFYFFSGLTAGSAKIFRASADDNNGGAEVLGLTYSSAGTLAFDIGGANVETATGLVANKWYGVEVSYVGGASYTISVRGNRTFTFSDTGSTAVSTGIGSHTLGMVSVAGAAGSMQFDEFEASRGATAIGFFPRGNARVSGSDPINGQVYDLFDVLDVLTEFRTGTLASGSPDAEEDGDVDLFDVLAVLTRFRTGSFPA